MGIYTGTNKADTIAPETLSAGVKADPVGSRPSDVADIINGYGGNDTLRGGGGGDTINGGGGNDAVSGVNGGNILHGDAGNDAIAITIFGGPGTGGTDVTNSLYGDTGDDRIAVAYGYIDSDDKAPYGTLSLYGGDGADVFFVDVPYAYADDAYYDTVPTYLYGGAGDDTIQGTKINSNSDGSFEGGDADFLYGGSGNDTYRIFGNATIVEKASEGIDTLVVLDMNVTLPANVENLVLESGGYYYYKEWYGTGNALGNTIMGTDHYNGDVLDGAAGDDRIFGAAGDDLIYGGSGNDSLAGQAGDDSLWGGAGNDHLGGGTGDDLLYGEDGVDVLTGRDGADRLSGGAGNDRFVYEATTDSKAGAANHDTILDMAGIGGAGGDRIDLARIDASTTTGGNQAFTFVSSTALLKAGQVHVVAGAGTNSLVQGEVDGKAGIDFEIVVQDGATKPGDWVAADFIL